MKFPLTSELPFSLRLIRKMHSILMQNISRRDTTPGEFR